MNILRWVWRWDKMCHVTIAIQYLWMVVMRNETENTQGRQNWYWTTVCGRCQHVCLVVTQCCLLKAYKSYSGWLMSLRGSSWLRVFGKRVMQNWWYGWWHQRDDIVGKRGNWWSVVKHRNMSAEVKNLGKYNCAQIDIGEWTLESGMKQNSLKWLQWR